MLERDINAFLVGNHLKLLSTQAFRNGYLWEVALTKSEPFCRRCGSAQVVRAGRAQSLVKEEPVRSVSVWLKIHKHRLYCKDCKKTTTESVPGIFPRRRSTQRFRKFIAQACGRMTDLSSVSRFYGVSHGFSYQVYYEQVEVKLREHQTRFKWPEVIGIDEHFFRRKNRITEFVTMITDLKSKRVFEMVHGKDHQSLQSQLERIPGRENVKVVVIDMSSTYKSFVQKFFLTVTP